MSNRNRNSRTAASRKDDEMSTDSAFGKNTCKRRDDSESHQPATKRARQDTPTNSQCDEDESTAHHDVACLAKSQFVFAKSMDGSDFKYKIGNYVFRRAGTWTDGELTLRCVARSDPKIRCKVRARLLTDDSSTENFKEVKTESGYLAQIISEEQDHNHPPDSSNSNRSSKDDPDEIEEKINDNKETPTPKRSTKPKKVPPSSAERSSRNSKEKASLVWQLLKTRRHSPKSEEKTPVRKTTTRRRSAKSTRQSLTEIDFDLPSPSLSPIAEKDEKQETPKKSRPICGHITRRAAINCKSPIIVSPKRVAGEFLLQIKKRSIQRLKRKKEGAEGSQPTVRRRATAALASDKNAHPYPVYLRDGRYFVMDGFVFRKERERPTGGVFLRCLEELRKFRCRARAVAIPATFGENCDYHGRHTNPNHNHPRPPDGTYRADNAVFLQMYCNQEVKLDEDDDGIWELAVSCSAANDHFYAKYSRHPPSGKMVEGSTVLDDMDLRPIAVEMHSLDDNSTTNNSLQGSRPSSPVCESPLEEQLHLSQRNGAKGKDCKEVSLPISLVSSQSSQLPASFNMAEMIVNYETFLNLLIRLQEGADVNAYPALVRLVGATGEQLVEYLTDICDDIGGEDDLGVDPETISLIHEQFKRERALYDLMILSSDHFRRLIEAYGRWLTPQTAGQWWNTNEMLEFLSRKILRSQKFRSTYTSRVAASHYTTNLRSLSPAVLPLQDPRFMSDCDETIRSEEMSDSLKNIRALLAALGNDVACDESPIYRLLNEFDSAAKSFLEYFENADKQEKPATQNGRATRGGNKRKAKQTAQKASHSRAAISCEANEQTLIKLEQLSDSEESADWPAVRSSKAAAKAVLSLPGQVTTFEFLPNRQGMKDILSKYNDCLKVLLSHQVVRGDKTADEFAKSIEEKLAGFGQERWIAYRCLKEYRAVCDLLTFSTPLFEHLLRWYQKWAIPEPVADWKNGYVFEYICRRILRLPKYRERYLMKAAEYGSGDLASTSRPLLPFGRVSFCTGTSSIRSKRMRSLGLHRRLAELRYQNRSDILEAMVKNIEKATTAFFRYLVSNKAWPGRRTFDENSTVIAKFKPPKVSSAVTLNGIVNGKKPAQNSKKNSRKGKNFRQTPKNWTPYSDIIKIDASVEQLERTLAVLNELPIPNLGLADISAIVQPTCLADAIVKDLSHMEIVLTVEELGRIIQQGQFEHNGLGKIVVRRGVVQQFGNSTKPNNRRRLAIAVAELPKCIPGKKILYDRQTCSLRLNGVPVALRCIKNAL